MAEVGPKEKLTPFGRLLRMYRRRADRLTQAALAELAGVNTSTVHNAETGLVERDVATRLVTALDSQLEFTPAQLYELAAAYLVPDLLSPEGKTRDTLAILIPHLRASTFWSNVASYIAGYAVERGYVPALYQHFNSIQVQLNYLQSLQDNDDLVGLIIAPAHGISSTEYHERIDVRAPRLIDHFRYSNIPIVTFDRMLASRARLPFIGIANEYAAYLAVTELVNASHSKIGAMFDYPFISTQAERLSGFKKALATHSLEYHDDWVTFPTPAERSTIANAAWDSANLADAIRHAKRLLESVQRDGLTAVFCANYHLAIAFLDAAREEDVAIPDKVSLITFDDIPELDRTQPPVARVMYSLALLARKVVEAIVLLREPGAKVGTGSELIGGDDITIYPAKGKPRTIREL